MRGDNIKTAETSNGKEHEWFNQIQYQVQDGPAKDLKLKLRYSVLRVSSNASDYNVGGDEIRATWNTRLTCSDKTSRVAASPYPAYYPKRRTASKASSAAARQTSARQFVPSALPLPTVNKPGGGFALPPAYSET